MKENTQKLGAYAFNYNDLSNDQIEAINMLEEEGLEFISSPIQIKHGTLMFKDTKLKNVRYSITKSGYARRYISDPVPYYHGGGLVHYQLNKKRPEGGHMNGEEYVVSRILKPGDYSGLADDIARVIEKYRYQELGDKYTNENKKEDMRAKTINEYSEPSDPEEEHFKYLKDSGQLKSFDDDSISNEEDIDNASTNEIIRETSRALEELFQQAAENGLDFEMLKDLSAEALDQIDWVEAGQM